MSAIMKNITYNHILLCLILLAMTGCASKTNIEANLDDGKSIVILPSYGTGISTMYWAKVGSNNTYNFSFHYGTSRLGTLSESGKHSLYFALPIEAGTYYIKSISVKSIGGFEPAYTEEYNSTFGDIVLEKTPEQVVTTVTDNNEKRYSTKQIVEPTTSYYKFDYQFDNNTLLGTITINPNEIALIPAVWINVMLKQNSCKPFDNQQDSFVRKIARNYDNPLTLVFGLGKGSNGIHTWYWSCPIKEFIVNEKSASLDEFIYSAKTSKMMEPIGRNFAYILVPQVYREFPKHLFEKIIIKNFEFGEMFKNAKKMESLEDGTERYVIDGSTDKQE